MTTPVSGTNVTTYGVYQVSQGDESFTVRNTLNGAATIFPNDLFAISEEHTTGAYLAIDDLRTEIDPKDIELHTNGTSALLTEKDWTNYGHLVDVED